MFTSEDNISGRGGSITLCSRKRAAVFHHLLLRFFLESLPHEHALKNLSVPQLIIATDTVSSETQKG